MRKEDDSNSNFNEHMLDGIDFSGLSEREESLLEILEDAGRDFKYDALPEHQKEIIEAISMLSDKFPWTFERIPQLVTIAFRIGRCYERRFPKPG